MKKNILLVAALCSLLFSSCASGSGASSSSAPYNPSASTPYYGEAESAASSAAAAPGEGDMGSTAAGESYLVIDENRTIATEETSMLTFSLKVDTAAYTNVQRYIESGNLPPQDAVRTEELINYFSYDADLAFGDDPFAVYTEVAPSPLDATKQMAFIRVKTPEIDKKNLPSSNLTFLIDTSGSMNSYDKLPLLKEAFSMLVETLDADDRVSIVTYAGSSLVVLDSARGNEASKILNAMNRLEAGGSTGGANGILTAYELAEKNLMQGGNNRVILATDGDFNVGPSSNEALSELIQSKQKSGVYLSILGFGTGNIRDDLMETLSKDGNGNYAYISSKEDAQKVLVEELASNLFTVADDVKAQIEFNPNNVKSYRLIGYENRALANEDFENDAKDAGEIGVGTDVVVLFELELADGAGTSLKYQDNAAQAAATAEPYSNELFEVRIRYKQPGGETSHLVTRPVSKEHLQKSGSADLQFACAVAEFGQLLRNADGESAADVLELAKENLGKDSEGYRKAFTKLVQKYESMVD